jgi:hypothetical protein
VHTQLRNTLIVASLVALALCAPALSQTEIRLGWRVTSASPHAPMPPAPTLGWSTNPPLPKGAAEDLNDIKNAFDLLAIPHKAVVVSDNGSSLVIFSRPRRGADPQQPAGVTAWTDWRDVDAKITIPDMATARFLSNNHLLLSHHPDGGPYVSCVVDLRHPTTRFQFSGYWLNSFRMTDSGKWAGITQDGVLCTGLLDPDAPSQAVTGTPVPSAGEVKNSIWLHDGSYLLVEKAGPTLQALNSVTGHVVSSRPGGLGPSMNDASPAGRDACVGYQPAAGECVFQVSLAGELTVTQWPYQLNGESTVCVSPNRKFAITQKQTPVGFVPRYCRRTPNALPSDTPPEWPVLPPGTQMQDIGWLAWQP